MLMIYFRVALVTGSWQLSMSVVSCRAVAPATGRRGVLYLRVAGEECSPALRLSLAVARRSAVHTYICFDRASRGVVVAVQSRVTAVDGSIP